MTLTPDQMKWEPNPRVPGLGVARIISKGTEAGAYVYRVKFPKGRVVQAHSHPDDRTYTVLEGTWYIGWGEKFDETQADCPDAGQLLYRAGRRGPLSSPHQMGRRSYR